MVDIRKTFRESLLIYFAPIVGAWRHMRGILGVGAWVPRVQKQFLSDLTPDMAASLLRYLELVNRHGGQLVIEDESTGARARIVWHQDGFEALPASLE